MFLESLARRYVRFLQFLVLSFAIVVLRLWELFLYDMNGIGI